MCIRALDYCPTVDLTFGEYLRALITADYDLVRDDDRGYRIAVIEGFRRRGIYPSDVKTLSVESLRWRPPDDQNTQEVMSRAFERLKRWKKDDDLRDFLLNWNVNAKRSDIFQVTEKLGGLLHKVIERSIRDNAQSEVMLGGLDPKLPFQIHSIRPTRRVGPDGEFISELVVEISQRRLEFLDDKRQRDGTGMFVDSKSKQPYDFVFRGGSTLIVNLDNWNVRYNVVKSMASKTRLQRQRDYLGGVSSETLHATYFGASLRSEPFAALHREL
jgi:hypothetical protein